MTPHLSAGIAFLAGLVSFVSPCVLPLVPAYLSFLTGSSLEELRGDLAAPARVRVIAHALAFIAGFTIIFVALGASASALGGLLKANRHLIAQILRPDVCRVLPLDAHVHFSLNGGLYPDEQLDRIFSVHMRDLFLEEYPFRKLLTRLNESGFKGYCLAEIPPSSDPVRVMKYFRK